MEEKNKFLPIILGGLIIVVTIAICGILLSLALPGTSTPTTLTSGNIAGSETTNSTTNTPTSTPAGSTDTTANTTDSVTGQGTNTSSYKDGTYSASGSYFAPSGRETIQVKIALADGAIKSLNITPDSNDFESLRYQQRFISKASSLVVGKKIDQAYLYGRINGASLTGEGFNSALDQIISQAQA